MNRYLYIKYSFDFVFAAILFVLTFWALLICAIIIKIDDPKSPVMYNAIRIGKDLKTFKMYKFRTMKTEFEGNGRVSENTLTTPGKYLRKFSLDELPQLLNILKGEMSFIGPRPLTKRYVPWYTKAQNIRHSVRPGLTGLAQINGRVNLSWDKRFLLDAQYVENMSFVNDMRIFFLTIKKTLIGEDSITQEDSDTYDYFDDFQKDQIAKGLVQPDEIISYNYASKEFQPQK